MKFTTWKVEAIRRMADARNKLLGRSFAGVAVVLAFISVRLA
jgi:hypothetical protein